MLDAPGRHLFAQAVVAFLALPGVVGFVVPAFIVYADRDCPTLRWPGLVPFGVGCVLLCWCVTEFYRAGRGTLAPWAPPKYLVTSGPYRWSRNPMYVGVFLILCGWAGGFPSLSLWIYTAAFAIAAHIRVVVAEEAFLARMHGAAWSAYKAAVRRWV